jgi:hypothetical protein
MQEVTQAMRSGYHYDGVAFRTFAETGGSNCDTVGVGGDVVPVYRLFRTEGGGNHFYTTDSVEKDNVLRGPGRYVCEGVAFWVNRWRDPRGNSCPIRRLYQPRGSYTDCKGRKHITGGPYTMVGTGHLYTLNAHEARSLGFPNGSFFEEAVLGYAYAPPGVSCSDTEPAGCNAW